MIQINLLVVKEAKFEDKKLNEQLMSSMLPLHSGEYFGWIGQLAYVYLLQVLWHLFVITGYMLYFDRWKKKRAKALKEKQVIFIDIKKRLRTKVLSLFMFSRNSTLKSLTTLFKTTSIVFSI